MNLLSENESLKSSNNILKKDATNKDTIIKTKSEEIISVKGMIEKMREDHIS